MITCLKKHKINATLLSIGSLFYCSSVCAQTVAEPVVVTASRIEQLQKEAISSTSVITQETLQNKKLATVGDILRSEAGIELAKTGGVGSSTSLFMRGTESRHVLVLLDGVPIQDGNQIGTVDLISHIQSDQIERIEVVKGNVSSLYGSGAIGGVIQIFTKKGTKTPQAGAYAEYGTHKSAKAGFNVSGQTEQGTSFALSASRFRTDGISSVNAHEIKGDDNDRDGARNVSVNASVEQKINRDNSVGARLYYYNDHFDSDAGYYDNDYRKDYGRSKQYTVALYSKNRFTEDWLSTVTVSHNDIRRKSYTDNTFDWMTFSLIDTTSKFESQTSQLQWDNQLALINNWLMTFGFDGAHEKAEADDDQYSRNKYSVYAGILFNMEKHHVQANVRYDHVDDAGSDVTGYLGYSYDVTNHWKLLANVSTAFLAPTLYQQYVKPTAQNWNTTGNKNLDSEKSTHYEAGIQYASGPHLARLTVFEWHTRDLITTEFNSSTYGYDYVNVGKAKNTGAELTAQTHFLGLDVKAQWTVQNPKNKDTDKQLLRRAKSFGSLDVSKTYGQWYVGVDVQYTGKRKDYSDTELDSYTLVNVNARYDINKHVGLYARLENLFDKQYETAYGYNQMGCAVFGGINFKL